MSGTFAPNQGKCKADKLSALQTTASSTHISSLLIHQLPFIYWLLYVCVSMGVPLSMCRSTGTEFDPQHPGTSWAYFNASVILALGSWT